MHSAPLPLAQTQFQLSIQEDQSEPANENGEVGHWLVDTRLVGIQTGEIEYVAARFMREHGQNCARMGQDLR